MQQTAWTPIIPNSQLIVNPVLGQMYLKIIDSNILAGLWMCMLVQQKKLFLL